MQLITQRIIKKYCCLNNKLLVYVYYVRTAFCVCDVLCSCFCFLKVSVILLHVCCVCVFEAAV